MTEERKPAPADTPLTVGLAVLAGIIRLVPHPWNMTPVGALGLFGGARLPLAQALTIPLTVLVTTDLLIWAAKGWMPFNPYVYAAFLGCVLLGRVLTKTRSPGALPRPLSSAACCSSSSRISASGWGRASILRVCLRGRPSSASRTNHLTRFLSSATLAARPVWRPATCSLYRSPERRPLRPRPSASSATC